MKWVGFEPTNHYETKLQSAAVDHLAITSSFIFSLNILGFEPKTIGLKGHSSTSELYIQFVSNIINRCT